MRMREVVVSFPLCSWCFGAPFLFRCDHPDLCKAETINPRPAIDRTFSVGDELENRLGRCRVEIDA